MIRPALCLAAVCSFAISGHIASAQPAAGPVVNVAPANGSLIRVPLDRPASRRNGLWLHFDSRWANNYGYRPLQVTVNTATPATIDRTIKVRLRVQPFDADLGSIQVEQEFDLPAGSAAATMTMSLPQLYRFQWTGGQYASWDVLVDGVLDRDLSREDVAAGIAFGPAGATDVGLSMLATDADVASRQSALSASLEYEKFSLPIREFPTRWLDYSCFDVVTLSADELESVRTAHPAALAAVWRWVMAGGQLWILDAGPGWQNLPAIEQTLQLKSRATAAALDGGVEFTMEQVRARGWSPAQTVPQDWSGRIVVFGDHNTGAQRVVRNPRTIDRLIENPRFYVISDQTVAQGRRTETDSGRWFIDHALGLGTVRAFRLGGVLAPATAAGQSTPAVTPPPTNNPRRRPGTSAPNSSATAVATLPELAAATETTLDWQTRHGLAPDEANPEFSSWLVPGVGLAPVREFQVLITLFVIIIGPVNYVLLKRYQRLHLLVITVPLAAVLLTLALFAYALVADGLGTRVRVRSLTMLDQRAGEAASWARLSYYSGLAPSRGLAMASETALYPIVARWQDTAASELAYDREIVWEQNESQLTRGWLRSRTPTQYLAIRSRPTSNRLQVQPGKELVRVKNELGAAIRYVVVTDTAGKLFAGEDVAPDETAELSPIEDADANGRFRLLLLDSQPQPPAALAAVQRGGVLFGRRRRGMYATQYPFTPSRLSENLMSVAITRWTTFDEQLDSSWRSRSFVAVTTSSPEVQLGFNGAEEEASFHIIVGRW
jgi:hypothetical protein